MWGWNKMIFFLGRIGTYDKQETNNNNYKKNHKSIAVMKLKKQEQE